VRLSPARNPAARFFVKSRSYPSSDSRRPSRRNIITNYFRKVTVSIGPARIELSFGAKQCDLYTRLTGSRRAPRTTCVRRFTVGNFPSFHSERARHNINNYNYYYRYYSASTETRAFSREIQLNDASTDLRVVANAVQVVARGKLFHRSLTTKALYTP